MANPGFANLGKALDNQLKVSESRYVYSIGGAGFGLVTKVTRTGKASFTRTFVDEEECKQAFRSGQIHLG